MEQQDLTAIYENMYRPQGNVIKEQASSSSEIFEEARKPKKKKSFKGKRRALDDKMIGAIEQVNSSYNFDNVFGKVLREMEEMGGADDNVFDADGADYDDDLASGGDDDTISISELRNMTLGEIVEMLSGGGVGEFEDEGEEDEGSYDFNDEMSEEDEIPQESYAFSGGEGNPKGAQGTYDGKARRQAKTTHVKDNGDAKFGDQDTGYDPEDVEGSEGSEHGAQGNYDGKARPLAKTNFVKGNGDADFSKVKTGMKTSSGKKDKNYF